MKRTIRLLCLFVLMALLLPACSLFEKTFDCEFTLAQVDEEQSFTISWTAEKTVEKLSAKVTHGEQVVAELTFEGDDLADNSVTIDAYYGKHDVAIEAYDSEGAVAKTSAQVAISASEYVIAPISGSMPQLYFTLYMNEITNNGEIPAFVWLTRPGSWNWNKLPENVHAVPTVDISEVLSKDNYHRMVSVVDAYIEELYSINNNSKFNFYTNDYTADIYMTLLPANNIPEENYNVVLLSDGGASYSAFNGVFNSDDPDFDADAKYAEMASNLEEMYEQARATGEFNGHESFSNINDFKSYAYVAAKEMNNVEWWVLRPRAGVLCSPDEEFINTVLTVDTVSVSSDAFKELAREDRVIIERNFAYPLTNMTEEEQAKLKEFYNFNDEMFAEAEAQGKKAMMILGSWATETNEPDFEDYAKLVMEYYGDEFVYYYKGHPNTPTVNYPEKQAQLERLDVIDVESSINAELILFFYPDIYMCGYPSSTFLSVESEEMACAVFNTDSAKAHSTESMTDYVDLVGMFISKIDVATSEYANLCPEADHAYYLMELQGAEYDYGIYDATTSEFAYYNK